MAMKYFFVFCFVILAANCTLQAQTAFIGGQVIDATSKEPVPFANVVIKNEGDSLINGVITNDKGNFELECAKCKVRVIISMIGYTPFDTTLNLTRNTIKLGSVKLTPSSTTLNEVVIEDVQQKAIVKFDRTIYPVTKDETNSASTILDLLRTLPGVSIDEENNVRFKGAAAGICIDDKPYEYLYPKVELIPVTGIEKIELIDVAMRSGGSGRGGIINIRYKQLVKDGISGMISANAKSDLKHVNSSNSLLNLNYKKKKLIFINNFSFISAYERNRYVTGTMIHSFAEPFSHQDEFIYRTSSKTFNDYFGCVYDPTKMTHMYFGVGIFRFDHNYTTVSEFTEQNLFSNLYTTKYTTDGGGNSVQQYKGFNFMLNHKFDTCDTYVKVNAGLREHPVTYNFFDLEQYSIFNSLSTDSTAQKDTHLDNDEHHLYCSVFYNHPVSKKTRWTLAYGMDGTFGAVDKSDYYLNEVLIMPFVKEDKRDKWEHGLSYRYGSKVGKFQLDAGLELSYEYFSGSYRRYIQNNDDTVQLIKKEYWSLLPSLNIYYSINDDSQIKTTFSRSRKTPSYFQLCDFIDTSSAYSWSSGNSMLDPVNSYSVYLGNSLTKKKFNFSTDLFYSVSDNEISRVTRPLTSLLYFSKYENASSSNTLGVEISSWFYMSKKLSISVSGSVFSVSFKNNVDDPTWINSDNNKLQYGGYVKANARYRLKKYSLSFYSTYNSREYNYSGYQNDWITSSFNINRSFQKNKLNVALGVYNIYDDLIRHGEHSESYGVISDTRSYSTKYKAMLYFSFRYNILEGDRDTQNLRLD